MLALKGICTLHLVDKKCVKAGFGFGYWRVFQGKTGHSKVASSDDSTLFPALVW